MKGDYIIGINLGWTSDIYSYLEIENQYKEWITTCSEHNIRIIRVFLCRWSINALYDRQMFTVLNSIVNYASEKGIEVILVLNSFTDFINKYQRDLSDNKYVWNSFLFQTRSIKSFFKNINDDYFNSLEDVLENLQALNNVKQIELFNELDLVEAPRKLTASWCNMVFNSLKKYNNRFKFYISIAHETNYDYFSKVLTIPIDIHFYNYPYDNAYLNLEYYVNHYNFVPRFGEYAKFSDKPHLEQIDALKFFCSGLWGGFLLKLEASPLHWWWNDLLVRHDYLKVIDLFYKHKSKNTMEFTDFSVSILEFKKRVGFSKPHLKKILTRLIGLLKQPKLLKQEYPAIKKFLAKYIYKLKQEKLFIRAYGNQRIIFYCETNNNTVFKFDLKINLKNTLKNPSARSINLLNGKIESLQVEQVAINKYSIKNCNINTNHLIELYNDN